MTKIKTSILQKSLGLASILFLFVSIISNIPTHARLADVTTNVSTAIAKDRTAPITIYFSYGSATADSDILTAVSKATLDKSDLEFVNTGIEDWYNGSPTRTDAENPPAQPVCNANFTGPKYQISSSLISANSFTYGLQSARNASAPSGSASVDKLREKATGCIKVTLRVSASAAVGSVVALTFDEDFGNSPSYADANRPGKQIVNFTIGAAQNTSSTPSSVATSSVAVSSAVAVSSKAAVSSVITTVSSVAPVNTSLARTGGAEVVTIIAVFASGIVGFIAFKVYKKRISKVDVGGGNFKGKK
jgi:hypothetical protein